MNGELGQEIDAAANLRKHRVGVLRVLLAPYVTSIGALYLLLGPIVGFAHGAAPLVMLGAFLIFALAGMTYAEGASMHSDRGGAAMFARHAFDEAWSFIAAWALLLDALLLAAAAASASTTFIDELWSAVGYRSLEVAGAIAILLAVAAATIRGRLLLRPRNVVRLLIFDVVLQLIVVGVAFFMLPDRGSIKLSEGVSVDGLLLGIAAASVVIIGLETASAAAGEVHLKRKEMRFLIASGPMPILLLYPLMAVAVLLAFPVTGGQSGLSEHWAQAPVLGIVSQLDETVLRDVLRALVAGGMFVTLIGLVSAAFGGASRIAIQMARHRQLPTVMGRLHPKFATPVSFIAFGVAITCILVVALDLADLVSTLAFGVTVAVAIAHISIIRLRFTEPDVQRSFKIPLSIRLRGGAEVPLPAVLGLILTVALWVALVIWQPAARAVGLGWIAVGFVGYVIYRKRLRLPVAGKVAVSESALRTRGTPQKYQSILVPLLGTALDDDIIQTAGRLADGADETDLEDNDSIIEAIWVNVMPVSVALDSPISDEKKRRKHDALTRAIVVGEEFENVRVETSTVRARSLGRAIVDEAVRRGCQAIVMVAPPPATGAKSSQPGSKLGARGGRASTLTDAVRYVIDHAPCQVILTAPALEETDAVIRRAREARANEPQESEPLTDEDEDWLSQL